MVKLFSFFLSCFLNFSDLNAMPSPYQMQLDELREHFFKTTNQIVLTPLTGGHSPNQVQNLVITIGSEKYVFKIRPKDTSEETLKLENYALLEAGKAKIGPAVYYITKDGRGILMEYVPVATLTAEDANKSDKCVQIAKAINKAHTIPKNPYFDDDEEEALFELYKEISDSPIARTQLQEAVLIIKNCNELLKNYEYSRVNNHGDLNSRNIFLTDKGLLLIDWECTYWADPFEDLAYFSLRHNYDDSMDRLFLKSYLNRIPNEQEMQRYLLTKKKYFAKLCIYFHYFSFKRNPKGPVNIAIPSSKLWKLHMIDFSHLVDRPPLDKFYFDLANCALECAKEMK